MEQKPNPDRFRDYEELPDGTGFTLPGNQFIFKYDQNHGWFDEYKNYYNANGQPSDPKAENEYFDDDYDDYEEQLEEELLAEYDIDENDYENNYDYQKNQNWKQIQKIEQLQSIIEQYGPGQLIEMYLTNLNFKLNDLQIKQFFLAEFPQKNNFMLQIRFGEKKGSAIMQTNNKEFAKHCVLKITELLMGRQIYMEIEPLENYDDFHHVAQTNKVTQINSNQPKPSEIQPPKQLQKPEEKKNVQVVPQQTQEQNKVSVNEEKKEDKKNQEKKIEQIEDDDGDSWGTIGKKKSVIVKVVNNSEPTKKQNKQQQAKPAQNNQKFKFGEK